MRSAERILLEERDLVRAWTTLAAAWKGGPRWAGDYGEGRENADPDADRREAALASALDAALAKTPRHAGAWLWRGALRRRALDYAGAAADLWRAHALGIKTAMLLTWRGEARLQTLDRTGGLADMKAALRRPDAAAWNWAWLGRSLLNHFRDRKGLDALDRAIALDPSWPEARAWRGEARRRLGDAAGSIADFDAALSLGPDEALRLLVRGWRALLLVETGRAKEADAELAAVSAAAPGRALWVHGRALAARADGRLSDWVLRLDEACALDSKYEKNLGLAAPEQREALLRDLASPDARRRPASLRLRGRLLLACGRAQEAERDLAAYAKAVPRSAAARLLLCEALLGQGKTDAARAALSLARALAPADAEAELLGARLELGAGDADAARAAYARALALDARCGPALAELGALELSLGGAAARDLLEKAVAVSHTDVFPLVDLSFARRRANDDAGAKEAWAKAVSLDAGRATERASVWETVLAAAPTAARAPRPGRAPARRRARP